MATATSTYEVLLTTRAAGSGVPQTLRGLDAVKAKLGEVKQVGSTLGSAFGFAELSGAALGAGAVAFLKDSIAAAAESEEAQVKLAQALKNTGQASEENAAKIDALASQYQQLTNVSDETWSDAAAQLVTFGAQVDELPNLFPVLEGLAGRMGGDVAGAARVLGMAVSGQARGLAQFGIDLEAGAGKAEIMAAVMEKAALGTGLLREQTQTTSGQVKSLAMAWGDLQEKFGQNITSGGELSAVLTGLASVIRFTTANLDRMMLVANSVGGLSSIFKLAGQAADLFGGSTEKAGEKSQTSAPKIGSAGMAADQASDGFKAGADEAEDLAKQLSDAASKADKLRSALDAVTEARLGRDQAQVNADEASGKITPAEAEERRAVLRGTAEKEKLDRRQKDLEAEQARDKARRDQLAQQRTVEQGREFTPDAAGAAAKAQAQKNVDDINAEMSAVRERMTNRRREMEAVRLQRETAGIDQGTGIAKADKMRREQQERDNERERQDREERDRRLQEQMDESRSPIGDRPAPREPGGRIDGRAPRSKRDTLGGGVSNLDDLQGGGSEAFEALKAGGEKAAAGGTAAAEAANNFNAAGEQFAAVGPAAQGAADAAASAAAAVTAAMNAVKAEMQTLAQQGNAGRTFSDGVV